MPLDTTPPDAIQQVARLIRDVRLLKRRSQLTLAGPWTPLSLASGFTTTAGSYTPAWRVVGDMVQLRGSINGTFAVGANNPLASIPAAIVPDNTIFAAIGCSSSTSTATARLTIGSGVFQVNCPVAVGFAALDGVVYSLE